MILLDAKKNYKVHPVRLTRSEQRNEIVSQTNSTLKALQFETLFYRFEQHLYGKKMIYELTNLFDAIQMFNHFSKQPERWQQFGETSLKETAKHFGQCNRTDTNQKLK